MKKTAAAEITEASATIRNDQYGIATPVLLRGAR